MRRLLVVLVMLAGTASAEEPRVTHITDPGGDRVPLQTVVPAYPETARPRRR